LSSGGSYAGVSDIGTQTVGAGRGAVKSGF
jgi:hypothetical protein